MIEIKNISKCYNYLLFDCINYIFDDGKIYLIKGDNGTGKSVLLKMICGFSKPDSGKIIIDGKLLYNDMDFIEDAGMTINGENFISYLNAYDNLKLLIDINKKVSDKEIEKYCQYFDLEEKHTIYKKFSQGMKQKLRLIQAFIEDPKYLILDEPTNALDEETIQKLYNLLIQFAKNKNKTIIIVSHTHDLITSLADKVLEIKNNKLMK